MNKIALFLAIASLAYDAHAQVTITPDDATKITFPHAACGSEYISSAPITTKDLMLERPSARSGHMPFIVDFGCEDDAIGIAINGKPYTLTPSTPADFKKTVTYRSSDNRIAVQMDPVGTTPGDESDVPGCMDESANYRIRVSAFGATRSFSGTAPGTECSKGIGITQNIDKIVDAVLDATASASRKNVKFDPKIRIGVIAPMTGSLSSSGLEYIAGAQLAKDEFNSKGASINGKPVSIELLSQDEAGDSRAAARNLLGHSINAVIGHLTASNVLDASNEYWLAGIPLVSPTPISYTFPGKGVGHKNIFPMAFDPEQVFKASLAYVRQTQSTATEKIYLIDQDNAQEWGFSQLNPSASQIDDTSRLNFYSIDWQGLSFSKNGISNDNFTALANEKPKTVLLNVRSQVLENTLSQLEKMKSIQRIVISPAQDEVCPEKVTTSASVDLSCVSAVPVGLSHPDDVERFVERYKQKFGRTPQAYAMYGYDAVQLLIDAMLKANSVEPDGYQLFLAKRSDYKGLTQDIRFARGSGALEASSVHVHEYKEGTIQAPKLVGLLH